MPALPILAALLAFQGTISLNEQLIEAVHHNDVETARRLLDVGADPNYRYHTFEPVIIAALRSPTSFNAKGSVEPMVRLLLDRGAKANVFDGFGWTPLTVAPDVLSYGLVRTLLEGGVDPNRVAMHGDPAINRFAGMGRLDVVRLLLDRGAKIDEPGYFHLTAFDEAAQGGHLNVLRFLASKTSEWKHRGSHGINPFRFAAQSSQDNGMVLEYLFAQGLRPDAPSSGDPFQADASPLHFAAAWGNPANVRWLLAHGANANLRDKEGLTPRGWALRAQRMSKADRSAAIDILKRAEIKR